MAITLPKFNKENARAEIARVAREDSSAVEILDHAIDRMVQRDITIRQVMRTLIDGDSLDINWDSENEKGWRCKLRYMSAGKVVVVIAKLVERESSACLVVTVWEG